jgi:hypothetical protein
MAILSPEFTWLAQWPAGAGESAPADADVAARRAAAKRFREFIGCLLKVSMAQF